MKFWASLSGKILRYRLPILIGIGVITVLMGWLATKAEMTYTIAKILPDDDVASRDYDEFRKRFGFDANVMVIGFESDRLFDKTLFNDWYQAGEELRKIPAVKNVMAIGRIFRLEPVDSLKKFNVKPIISHLPENQAEMDSIQKAILSLTFYKDLLITKGSDGKYATTMLVTLDQESIDRKDRKELIEHITAIGGAFAEKNKVDIHYSGLPYIRTVNSLKIKEELSMFLYMSLIVTALVLFLFFRSVKAIIFPMLVVIISVIWCVGTMVLLGYKITILTGLIPPLIVIIGIPNCIYLTNSFHREYRGHGNKIKAISRVIQRIGNATFLTNFNNVLGFITFAFTQSDVLKEFGILSSINVMQVFVLSLTILPIFYSYAPSPKPKQTKHLDNKLMSKVVDRIFAIVSNYRPLIYSLTFVVIGISAYGMTKIRTTGNFTDDIPRDDRIMVDLRFFESHFHGMMPFEITIDTQKKNGAMKLQTLHKIDALQHELEKFPEFSRALSIVELVKFSKQSFYNGDTSEYALPNKEEVTFLLPYAQNTSLNASTTSSFLDSNKQVTRLSVQMADIGTTEMKRITDQVRPVADSIFPPDKFKVTLTGTSIVFLKGTDYLIENLLTSLLTAIILISGLMYFMFYSWKMLVISIVPNVIPLIFTAGLMGFAGISLKSSTILVFNIAYGITVDSAIHFFSRYGIDLKTNRFQIKPSVNAALKDTGVSIIYTSTILLLGFCIFIFSTFGGTIALGFLVSVTIFLAVFTNLFLLPSLLLSMDRAFKVKVYKEPLILVYDEEEDINLKQLKIRKINHHKPQEPLP
ncbi:MAG: MMPL family transporter [Bacteroidia bacterium]|nr:MMPL family transporter [Bacteroidia bacterium]